MPTEAEQRIRIAEALGWSCDDHGYWKDASGKYGVGAGLPDFPNSRDACNLFEESLEGKYEAFSYAQELIWVINRDGIVGSFRLIRATPKQRCEAFLRIKGLWQK